MAGVRVDGGPREGLGNGGGARIDGEPGVGLEDGNGVRTDGELGEGLEAGKEPRPSCETGGGIGVMVDRADVRGCCGDPLARADPGVMPCIRGGGRTGLTMLGTGGGARTGVGG
jgi:hypothetical protein